jgi:hypothetical protein
MRCLHLRKPIMARGKKWAVWVDSGESRESSRDKRIAGRWGNRNCPGRVSAGNVL